LHKLTWKPIPSTTSCLFENDHVRVIRGTFGPGEKSPAAFDANGVVLVRTKGTGPLTITLPDGKVVTGASMAPGDAGWAPPGHILPENRTNELIEFIVIDPKR
jgi:hypothetical protein